MWQSTASGTTFSSIFLNYDITVRLHSINCSCLFPWYSNQMTNLPGDSLAVRCTLVHQVCFWIERLKSVDFPAQHCQAGKIFPSKYLDFFVDDQPSVSQAETCFLCPSFFLGISVLYIWPKKDFDVKSTNFSFVSKVVVIKLGIQRQCSCPSSWIFDFERQNYRKLLIYEHLNFHDAKPSKIILEALSNEK